ncbi:hypothetical protein PV10_03499 [Exophiala mesophila]|uniref:NTF2-like domain-containing protein n=1 Tax=Exophiala mesophila TaxID=212818 RepID=A0A0D2AAE7_EXOME|nr:uncharacterized protein PV10_03499 [Exophiala mesophila]KIV95898.1 hypothetical protein PV10_03499 [Exophiala mesophila]
MQYLSVVLPLAAMVSGALAAPGSGPVQDACLAAVTGKAALGDAAIRAAHCKSFLATTVTPPAITETVTITAAAGKDGWKRGVSVTVCPNQVPNYASACDEAHYTSACSVFGYTIIKTTTIAPTTTTKTVYVKPTSGATCPTASIVTKTITVTAGATTGKPATTTTAAPTTTTTATKCNVANEAAASKLVDNFKILLEYTDYVPANGSFIPAGRGYKRDVSAATLNDNFVDISDSINFMAGFPLGSVTFASKAAFDYGQGVLQPEVKVETLNMWYTCDTITWRWVIKSTRYPVIGINQFIVGDDGKFIKNYAEFDNGAWLQSFGQQCALQEVKDSGSNALKARQMFH